MNGQPTSPLERAERERAEALRVEFDGYAAEIDTLLAKHVQPQGKTVSWKTEDTPLNRILGLAATRQPLPPKARAPHPPVPVAPVEVEVVPSAKSKQHSKTGVRKLDRRRNRTAEPE